MQESLQAYEPPPPSGFFVTLVEWWRVRRGVDKWQAVEGTVISKLFHEGDEGGHYYTFKLSYEPTQEILSGTKTNFVKLTDHGDTYSWVDPGDKILLLAHPATANRAVFANPAPGAENLKMLLLIVAAILFIAICWLHSLGHTNASDTTSG